ncbi:hypothetical protein MCOR19_008461 [Pyricularia oryzae]|nr:hypothetical protein MCOR19_008461 [Pyricularia oryzae]KAI6482761.1 hypothetical protein MCOR18_004465 [Pyricularia oryzae]
MAFVAHFSGLSTWPTCFSFTLGLFLGGLDLLALDGWGCGGERSFGKDGMGRAIGFIFEVLCNLLLILSPSLNGTSRWRILRFA